MNNNNWY